MSSQIINPTASKGPSLTAGVGSSTRLQAPHIPDNAPFSPEQRAWLNGFLAGWYSLEPATLEQSAAQTETTSVPVSVVFGTQTGGAKSLARETSKKLSEAGFAPTVIDIAELSPADLPKINPLLLLTSTYGKGDPPDSAKEFHAWLHGDRAPNLENIHFSVLALGDTNYEEFCKCGRDFDTRLEQLGAHRIYDSVDCDVDYEEPFQQWLAGVVPALEAVSPTKIDSSIEGELESSSPKTESQVPSHSKNHPFPAPVLKRTNLNGEGSSKETWHVEISLAGSGLDYVVGDALGVFPRNCPKLVDDMLKAMNFDGEESVTIHTGEQVSLKMASSRHYEIRLITRPILQ